MGKLRTSDDTYYQAWLPYMTKIGQIIAANQITRGGVCIKSSPRTMRHADMGCVARHPLPG
jgi:hypothetical protein